MKKVVIAPANNCTRHQCSSCASPDNSVKILAKYLTANIPIALALKSVFIC